MKNESVSLREQKIRDLVLGFLKTIKQREYNSIYEGKDLTNLVENVTSLFPPQLTEEEVEKIISTAWDKFTDGVKGNERLIKAISSALIGKCGRVKSREDIEKIVGEWSVFHYGNTGMTEGNIEKLIDALATPTFSAEKEKLEGVDLKNHWCKNKVIRDYPQVFCSMCRQKDYPKTNGIAPIIPREATPTFSGEGYKKYPDCYKDCKAVKEFGAGECENICPGKFKPTEQKECKCKNPILISGGVGIVGSQCGKCGKPILAEKKKCSFCGEELDINGKCPMTINKEPELKPKDRIEELEPLDHADICHCDYGDTDRITDHLITLAGEINIIIKSLNEIIHFINNRKE